MKRLPLFAILLFAALAQSAVAETWYWSPSRQSTLDNGDKVYYWQDGQNWTNSAAARGAPTRGDTAVLGRGHADGGPYGICEDGENSALHEVRFEGGQTVAMSHGSLMLQGGGGGLAYLLDADSTDNRAGLCLVGDGEVPVHIARNRSFALQTGVKKSGDGTPALVKTGPGRFVCFGQAGSGEYTVPLTLVRQGAYDITTDSTLDGVTIAFDGNDGSQRIVYCHRPEDRLDLKLKDIGFYETNGVANTEHGFSSQNDNQVKFTGAPRQNPTVFSGTFYSKSGLDWAPDSEDCMFVCSNAVSATAGAVIVTKGTVKLVTGASFTSLSRLNVAAGATFEVAAGSGANFHADALKLEDATAKLRLGTAVELTMGAATLDGIPLLHGTYTADGADDTHQAAWIEGAGSVTVENGPDQVDTWCGGGVDNLATTDANWESGEAPDITAGDLVAIFATGGTRADLPAGTAAAFDGIVLDGANLDDGHFELAAGSGATATIGARALTVADAPSTTTWTIRWPITLAGGAQTWNVGENNTVEFDAPIGGDQDLVFAGSGTVELNAGNAHSGSLLFDSGTFTITASGALGSSSRAARYYYDRASLAFNGDLTIDPPIDGTYLSSPNATAGGLKITMGSDVTFNGRVHSSTYMWMTVGPGGMATFENGLGVGANAMLGHLSLDGGGTVVVRNVAADMGGKTMVNGGTTLDVRVAGNQLNAGDAFWTEINDGTLVTRVADALADGSMVYLGSSGVFDLDGHDQSVSTQHGIAGAKVASSRPATLTILGDQDGNAHDSQYGGAGRTNRTAFVGQVNLTKLGSVQQTLAAASTSTGTLKVASGTLSLVGSWENCTNLVVAGGTFAAKNANAFGDDLRAPGAKPKLEVDVASGASLVLDYDGQIDCSAFRVDGVSLRGTIGAPGSGADNEYAWISGPGLMHVWGYADWAAANGVSGAWDEKDALGIHNVFRYAFDETNAVPDPPLLDIAIEGGNAVVKTPPVANTEGFTVSVVESSDVAGATVTARKPLDATGRTEFPMGFASSRFYRLSAIEGDVDLVGVQLWEGGPYWAKCNVGATALEESGYYFWWGDTVGYIRSGGTWMSWGIYLGVTWVSSTGEQMGGSPFSLSSCPTYDMDNSTLQSEGYIDSTGNLAPEYDAATAHLGAPWRMPTDAEFAALTNNCTSTWITTNGVKGCLVTGKGDYADRSIFLPVAGYGSDSNLGSPNSQGYYWSSTPDSEDSHFAWHLYFNSNNFRQYIYYGRQYGLSVRPVRDAD